ncbi:MAG TPA: hypothetical protein VIY27_13790 [Myxococcota bacterium]
MARRPHVSCSSRGLPDEARIYEFTFVKPSATREGDYDDLGHALLDAANRLFAGDIEIQEWDFYPLDQARGEYTLYLAVEGVGLPSDELVCAALGLATAPDSCELETKAG